MSSPFVDEGADTSRSLGSAGAAASGARHMASGRGLLGDRGAGCKNRWRAKRGRNEAEAWSSCPPPTASSNAVSPSARLLASMSVRVTCPSVVMQDAGRLRLPGYVIVCTRDCRFVADYQRNFWRPRRGRSRANGTSAATANVATAARAAEAPTLDGDVLGDPAWAQATPITGFTQEQPNEGEPVSERTEVRVVFTNDTLYIGAVDVRQRSVGHHHVRLAPRLRRWTTPTASR